MSSTNREFDVPTLALGKYVHYKDADLQYEVIGVGLDTESEEPVVIYRPLYESDVAYWIRPYDMFVETVKVNDEIVPRFRKID